MLNRRGFVVFIVFLFACTHKENPDAGKTVFRFNESSGITSLDPAFAKDQPNTWACVQLYNGLLQLDNHLHVQPCIAKTWEIKDSGRIYIFHLRNDVFFHENSLLKAGERQAETRNVLSSDSLVFLQSLS